MSVTLHWLEVGKRSSETIISAGVSQCVKKVNITGGLLKQIEVYKPVINRLVYTCLEVIYYICRMCVVVHL